MLWNLDPSESFRVIKASALLTPSMKLLWMEDHLLSRAFPAKGSFLVAEKMGKRLRLSTSTVEQMRRAFLSFELYLKKSGSGRGNWWMPCLPSACVPARGEKSDELFLDYGDRLDAHLRRRVTLIPPSFFYVLDYLNLTHGKPRASPTDTNGSDPPDTTGQTHGMPEARRAYRRSLALHEGGKGGVPSQESPKESSLLTDLEREGSLLTKGGTELREGGEGPGEGGRASPEAMKAAMDELKQRLAQGGTDGQETVEGATAG